MPWFVFTSIACSLPNSREAPGGGYLGSDPALDADGDGYSADLDCNDDDASVHPGAEEICDNGRDDNCHEGADGCGWSGDTVIDGVEIGSAVHGVDVGTPTVVCDVNADGQRDLVMAGADMNDYAGTVYVFHGPLLESRTIDDADYVLDGSGPLMFAGSSLDCLNDVDGDGVSDLVVGERGNLHAAAPWGAAYVVSGDGMGRGAIDDEATISWTGKDESALGYEVVALDHDGNGRDDVAVTLWGVPHEPTQWGRTFVITEPGVGDAPIETAASAYVYGTGWGDWIIGARNAGDLDGDGIQELGVVRRNNDPGTQFDSVYLFRGPLFGARATADADVRIADAYQGFGVSAGHADLDADGKDDFFVGNHISKSPSVYVFLGEVVADTHAAAADLQIHSTAEYSGAGSALSSPGDVSGDGTGDLLVAAPGNGAVYLIGGGVPGVYDLDTASQAVLRGDQVGYGLATGEVTGDTTTDFVIRDSSLTSGGSGVVVMPGFNP